MCVACASGNTHNDLLAALLAAVTAPVPLVQTDTDSDSASEYADASEHGGLEWVADELAELTLRSDSIQAEMALGGSSARHAELAAMQAEVDALILQLYDQHLV